MIRLTLLLSFLCITTCLAQKKITSINVTVEIVSAYVDRVGDIYTIANDGQIQKFDTNGKLLSVYRSGRVPTLFEPRDGSRLFAFFRRERKIEYLNPSFAVQTTATIDSAFVIDPWLVCTSGDHNLWMMDAADHTLKKISPRTSDLLVDVKIPENISTDYSQIKFIREYLGFFFLHDKTGALHVFNGMGRWIRTLAIAQARYFNFLGEEIYYPDGDKLIFINLHSGDKREITVAHPFETALVTDERLFLVQKNRIDFFEFRP